MTFAVLENPQAAGVAQNENWKSDGFVNILLDIPQADGSVRTIKIGKTGIGLSKRRVKDAEHIANFEKNTEAYGEFLKQFIRIDYQAADGSTAEPTGLTGMFDLRMAGLGQEETTEE